MIRRVRHPNPDEMRQLAEAMDEARARNWRCCGDLITAAIHKTYHFKALPDAQRFALTCARAESGCWEWLGARKPAGYGQFRFRGSNWNAHRVAYTLYVGEVSADLTLDHLCRNKGCVNPEHLEPVTAAVNTQRWSDSITHCPQGHAFADQNPIVKNGHRSCRLCHQERTRKRNARQQVAIEASRGHGRVKLSDNDIVEMRRRRAAGGRVRDIALDFGVTAKYASAVMVGSRTRKRRQTGPSRSTVHVLNDRSGMVCEFADCRQLAEHTHHRRPRRMGSTRRSDTNLAANLVRLCPTHHEWVEVNRAAALEMGLLLHDAAAPDEVPVLLRHGRVLLDNEGSFTPAGVSA